MNEGLISTPLDALRGRVSGVSIPVGGNSAAALAAVRVRGTTSLTGGNDPLVIIDGVFADLNLLSSIYPADIENFTILKDASETAQYGSQMCIRDRLTLCAMVLAIAIVVDDAIVVVEGVHAKFCLLYTSRCV